jgi:hypothetical protein
MKIIKRANVERRVGGRSVMRSVGVGVVREPSAAAKPLSDGGRRSHLAHATRVTSSANAGHRRGQTGQLDVLTKMGLRVT